MSFFHANKRDNFLATAITNRECYDFYYDRIKELSMSMFEWINMPPEIDIRYLELMMFERGGVVFFKDDVTDKYVCLPFTQWGKFDIYRIPIFRRAFASNGYNVKLDQTNSVIIYNNALRTPSIRQAKLFAKRLANFDRVIDVNVHAQRTPVLIRCDEKERLTLENLYMKYDGNQPVIFGDKNLSSTPIDCISTEAPYVADKIYELKVQYWNEMLTYNGISNVSYQKKERMVKDEIVRSQGGTIASRYSPLNARKRGCELINEMFGLDIDVAYHEDYRMQDDEFMVQGETDPNEGEIDSLSVDFNTNSPLARKR